MTLIELIGTITPAIILILIAFPSFKLLYLMDEVSDPAMSVLAEGHQGYGSYQYPDFLNTDNEFIEFDSYLVPESDLEDGGLRMLEVDNRVILPELTHVRFIVTAADVITLKDDGGGIARPPQWIISRKLKGKYLSRILRDYTGKPYMW